MPSLKVKKNGVWEYAQGGGNADTVDGKHATDFASATDFNAHTGDANNPHGVTAEMVGAADKTLSNLSDTHKALVNIGGRPRKFLNRNPFMEVNQRGASQYGYTSGSQVGIDGYSWGGSGYVTLDLVSGGFTLTGAGQILQNFDMTQRKLSELVGKSVTASILFADGTLLTQTSVVPSFPNNTYRNIIDIVFDTNHRLRVTQVSNSKLYLQGVFVVSGTIQTIRGWKVEIGEGQTLAYKDANGVWQLFDDYDYLSDLQECQRYFQDYKNLPVLVAATQQYTNNYRTSGVILPVKMITTPAITVLPVDGYVAFIDTVGSFADGISASVMNEGQSMFCGITTENAAVAGKQMYIRHIQLSAEL